MSRRAPKNQAPERAPQTLRLTADAASTVPMAQRPAFADLLAQVRAGDTLHAAGVDALGRDALDVQATVRTLLAAGVTIDIEGLGIIGPGAGDLILAVLTQVADMDRRRIVARTSEGRAQARATFEATGKTHNGKDRLGGHDYAANPESVAAWRLKNGASIRATAVKYGLSDATVKRYCAMFRAPGDEPGRAGPKPKAAG